MPRFSHQQKERLRFLKKEASMPKSALIRILNEVEAVSPTGRDAKTLTTIIRKLEMWQNRE